MAQRGGFSPKKGEAPGLGLSGSVPSPKVVVPQPAQTAPTRKPVPKTAPKKRGAR